jgi:hypothetical protein
MPAGFNLLVFYDIARTVCYQRPAAIAILLAMLVLLDPLYLRSEVL